MPAPKHIVAVAGLVTNTQGSVLMLRSPRRDWEFPGGQVEEGETLTQALQREIMEETGVRVSVGKLAGVYSNIVSHIVMFDFLCEWIEGEPCTSPESLEVAWVDCEQALARITRPAIRERMRVMLEFDGQALYRAYSFAASEIESEVSETKMKQSEIGENEIGEREVKMRTEYTVHEERSI